ncbi:MAG TPA: condensation domain-containing protein, partial [Thermoanaerobaculia bacterium]|nr:condensation domain-containing protein [Thermoanaerobaculia bacterium]
SFDVALEQILAALQAGATLVLRGEGAWSAQELDGQILAADLSVVNLPTGYWQRWLQEGDGVAASTPRLLIAGGDVMAPSGVLRWLELPRPPRLLNAYGPTEGVITASLWEVPARAPAAKVPIGTALPGRRLHVLDRAGRPVPPGVPGELCLGGPVLARGYLGRPSATATSFVPDPLSGESGARAYRTGDLARRRPDGALEFLGRIDRQVKVRGFRVELGEIEEALRRHPAVRDAVAVLHGGGAEDGRIVAYVVPAEGGTPPPDEELRGVLELRLPSYMLPSAILAVPEMPLTDHGKLDRRSLPDPAAATARQGEGYLAPRTPLESSMAEIWEDVLGRSPIGLHDDFFEAGGHSLLGTLVITRVVERFGVELPLQSLFAAPTLGGFAARVEEAMADGPEAAPPIEPVPRDSPLPLSFAQQRLWFLEQMDPGTPVYLLPAALRVSGPLDPDALESAVQEVARRHEVLRTRFAVEDDRPVQVVAPEPLVPVTREDFSHLPPAERARQLHERALTEVRQPFDLAAGPLLRLRILRLAEAEHILLLTLHHVVADAWSFGVLLREVAETYPALARGEASTLPPLPIQYADFAVWQRSWLQGPELERQVEYWRGELDGVPPLELPFASPRPASPSHRGALRRFEVGAELAAELRALAEREGATLFMTLLAALETVLYRLSGQESFPVGTGIANRNHPGTENLIGFFVNTLVLRADLSGNPTFRELLSRVRETALGAYARQDLPYEKLVEELRPGRDPGGPGLFQVMFLFQNTPMPPLRVGDLTLAPERLDIGTSHCDLTVELQESGEGSELQGIVEFATDRFDGERVDALVDHFLALLHDAAASPDRPVLELPLRAPAMEAGAAAAL